MRILYSVHRYGEETVGGAETACRHFCEQLASRGHDVTVITSCARSYVDWANHYPAGETELNGVVVRRVEVEHPRDPAEFSRLHAEVMAHPATATFAEQFEWLTAMGPLLRNYSRHLEELSARADATVFMTYLYPTAAFGVPVLSGRVPVMIQPTLHDEPAAHAPYYRAVFRGADAALFLSDEEKQVAERLYGWSGPSAVTGIGMDSEVHRGNGPRFRQRHGLGDFPYLIYVGRVDVFKGVSELMRYFVEFKGRNHSDLKLVIAGEQLMDIPTNDDIVSVGFLDEQGKADAIAGSVALVQPSPYESFSIVLCEAWLQEKPVLVQSYSVVLAGQCRRSGGGLPYSGFAEFEGCVRRLLDDPALCRELGSNGAAWVTSRYGWNSVVERLVVGLNAGIEHFRARRQNNLLAEHLRSHVE